MTWVKLDDHIVSHPKVVAAGPEAMWLQVSALCYCAQQLTDGVVPKGMVPMLAPKRPAVLARRLVDAGIWLDEGDHYRIHDYHDYQPSREQVESQRDAARERQRKSRRRSRRDSVVSSTPPTPDPYPTAGEPPDSDDDRGCPSSSWSDAAIFTEAGEIAAREKGGEVRDFDSYARSCERKIRSERGKLLPRLRELGLSGEEIAYKLAFRDAEVELDLDDLDQWSRTLEPDEFEQGDHDTAAWFREHGEAS